MRFAVGDTTGDIPGTPRLSIGVMSSPTSNLSNGPLGGAVSNFFGVITNSGTWTRETNNYHLSQTIPAATRLVNTTTILSPVSSSIIRISQLPSTKRNAFFLFIDKGTDGVGDWKIASVHKTSVDSTDVTYAQLVTAMEVTPTEPVLTTRITAVRDTLNSLIGVPSNYASSNLSATANVNEATNGPLNAIVIAWDKVIPFYISEVIFAKQA